ncbi:hypothetical protein LTR84_003691 [Exophiala bonariae]|uniref:tRNA (adenine(58)-N(1))-methyltransferase catalytic subunit TRM61 n=1 Tax=Exophiala bonariae TaxID=1690606 RepID=A0AAV9N5Z3_9EURO|nr:hypothetical protein LTR84_003691 [Exophiala bonariae]
MTLVSSPADCSRPKISVVFKGDRVIVDGTKLSKPLIKNGKTPVRGGDIPHNDIIGREASKPFFASSSKDKLFRISRPTITQYISQTPRLVTPIYSEYAETIVSLLDIHTTPFRSEDDANETFTTPPLEILDSGTGHGSLSLHLARAITTANPPPLDLPVIKPAPSKHRTQSTLETTEPNPETPDDPNRAWTEWKRTRRAVIHSVEAIRKTSRHAETVVRGYRQGQYWPHIDFHQSDLSAWLSTQTAQRDHAPFLSYVFLDLPDVQERLKECFPAMHDGAKVVIFVPSITQVSECVKMIKKDRDLRLNVDTVVELGEGISNGRIWTVRAVTPRTIARDAAAAASLATTEQPDPTEMSEASAEQEQTDIEIMPDEEGITTTNTTDVIDDTLDPESSSSLSDSPTPSTPSQHRAPPETVMICRPQIGEKIVGGGFVAVFSKMSPEQWELQYRWRATRTGVQKKMLRA